MAGLTCHLLLAAAIVTVPFKWEFIWLNESITAFFSYSEICIRFFSTTKSRGLHACIRTSFNLRIWTRSVVQLVNASCITITLRIIIILPFGKQLWKHLWTQKPNSQMMFKWNLNERFVKLYNKKLAPQLVCKSSHFSINSNTEYWINIYLGLKGKYYQCENKTFRMFRSPFLLFIILSVASVLHFVSKVFLQNALIPRKI